MSNSEKDPQQLEQVQQPAALPAKKPGSKVIDKVFSRWMTDEEETMDWVTDANTALVYQEPLRARAVLYLVFVTLVCLVIWAAFADIDEVTRGEAKVIPTGQVQIVQSLDGGVVTSIEVKEGDIVDAGQLLIRLDATRSSSSLRENEVEYLALQVKAARLKAVAEGIDFTVEDEWQGKIPDVVAQQQILYDSSLQQMGSLRLIAEQQLLQRRQELVEVNAKLKQASKSFDYASKELSVTAPLVSSGAVSEVEILRLKREVSSFDGERDPIFKIGKIFQSPVRTGNNGKYK